MQHHALVARACESVGGELPVELAESVGNIAVAVAHAARTDYRVIYEQRFRLSVEIVPLLVVVVGL